MQDQELAPLGRHQVHAARDPGVAGSRCGVAGQRGHDSSYRTWWRPACDGRALVPRQRGHGCPVPHVCGVPGEARGGPAPRGAHGERPDAATAQRPANRGSPGQRPRHRVPEPRGMSPRACRVLCERAFEGRPDRVGCHGVLAVRVVDTHGGPIRGATGDSCPSGWGPRVSDVHHDDHRDDGAVWHPGDPLEDREVHVRDPARQVQKPGRVRG